MTVSRKKFSGVEKYCNKLVIYAGYRTVEALHALEQRNLDGYIVVVQIS